MAANFSGNQPGQSFGGDENVKQEAGRVGNQQTNKAARKMSKQYGGIPDSATRIYDPEKPPFQKAAASINVNGSFVDFEPVKSFVEMILNFADGLEGKKWVAPEI